MPFTPHAGDNPRHRLSVPGLFRGQPARAGLRNHQRHGYGYQRRRGHGRRSDCHRGTNRQPDETVSGKDGRFVFPTLLPSGYTISVTATGFESYSQTGVVLEADQALTINITVKVGAQTQTVSVTADAPQVDVTTGTLSQVIDQAALGDMPLNGRAAASLVTLIAGVVDATNEGNGVNQGSGKTFSGSLLSPVQVATVNGTLPNQDNFLLDGATTWTK